MGFARSGVRGLVLADINLESATRAAIESQSVATNPNFRAEAIQINVADPDSVQNAIDRTVGIFERIDYCVNGAGVSLIVELHPEPLLRIDTHMLRSLAISVTIYWAQASNSSRGSWTSTCLEPSWF